MKINFMLIDDSEIDLFVNQKYIEKTVDAYEIRTYQKAREALKLLTSYKNEKKSLNSFYPDIILLDINMPEMDGYEFLNALEKLSDVRIKGIKIYLLSSSTHLDDILNAEKHENCEGFIRKPLTTRKLEQILEKTYVKKLRKLGK